jgi:phosphoglycerate dehydrogenase-like enzyme
VSFSQHSTPKPGSLRDKDGPSQRRSGRGVEPPPKSTLPAMDRTGSKSYRKRVSRPNKGIVVAVATPIEAELVAAIEAVDDQLDVRYEPDLLPPRRFPCDHRGVDDFRRNMEQEASWRRMLASAEVVFGVPGESPQGLGDLVRANAGLRWVQAASSRAVEQVHAAGLTEQELDRVVITTVSGIHDGPLAEFAMFGILAFAKKLPRLLADTQARRWDPYPMSDLADKSLLVVGLGSVGIEVARLAKAFGMHVSGVNRTGRGNVPAVDTIRPPRFLGDLLPIAHAVVVTLPMTEQTKGMIEAQALSRMRADSVLVGLGGGGVIDEQALIRGLERGQPAGAVLDVFATEPLPPESPLWSLPNVLISPHTAALSVRENQRIVRLFAQNLRRYLRGDELIGRV